MDIVKLKYFYTVAKHQHVTQAAEELHIAQPALTKSIKLLEEELEVELFYRKGRNVRLTEYGKFLKEKLDVLLPEFDALPQKVFELKSKVGKLVRLNVLTATNLVTDAVVDYKKKHPDVIFELTQNAECDCDITVFTQTAKKRYRADDGDLISVFDEEVFLVVPKFSVYGDKTEICLKEVKDESFISVGGLKNFKAICNGFCALAGFIPSTTFESDSALAVKKVIAAKAGVGFWPEYSWGRESHSGVSIVKIKEPECRRKIIVVRHDNGNNSSVVDEFYKYLSDFVLKQKEKVKLKNSK